MIDTGAQFSCVRADVIEYLHLTGLPCSLKPCKLSCLLADGTKSQITNTVTIHFGILRFSWTYEFKILPNGPFPVILGLDFLQHSQMTLDVCSKSFRFTFAPEVVGTFGADMFGNEEDAFLRELCVNATQLTTLAHVRPRELCAEALQEEYPNLFSSSLGTAKCMPYEIELCDATPVRSPPYRCGPPKLQILKQMVNELLSQGVIRPSKSPYASPAFLVPKNSGGSRLVVDYRKVNSKILFDSYPLPTIEQALEQFHGAVIFSVLDLNSAYFQIPLSSRSRRVTAFCTPFGLFEFNKLPMGISIGSQGLSRVVDELFADEKNHFVFNYLDDLIVYSRSLEEHGRHLRSVLDKLQSAGFTLNIDKVTLAASQIKYLGHLLSARGVSVLPDRVTAIQGYPPPQNLRALRRFLGMVGFYARFIPNFSHRAAPLHALKKKGSQFIWTTQHQDAFDDLKALSESPVLQIPDFSGEFVLVTDASDLGVSAVLNQQVGVDLAPIAYYSRLLSPAERNYSTYEKECLAVLSGCDKFRSYLEHKEFVLQCDNLALCWLLKRVKEIGRLGRWIIRLSPFKFKVVHTKGSDNVVADALSRVFDGTIPKAPQMLCMAVLESLPLVYSSLQEHQQNDPFCQDVKNKITSNLGGVENFRIYNNLLCFMPRGAKRRRWVVPPMLRSMLLKYFHDAAFAGHLGAFKTYRKVAANFWWPQMRAEIFQYVRRCDLCQRAKPAQNTLVGLHAAQPPSQPLERVFLDFMGPLTRTRRGHTAILVIMDGFSKFVTFFPVRRISSQTVVECLERSYFPVYGTPRSIVTDNASVFCSKQIRLLCFKWAVEHITTTPYYPQSSLVERVNRNLKSALKIFHSESQNKWDEDLPLLSVGFNTAVHESSKFTPDVLFLGREINSPLSTRWDLSSHDQNTPGVKVQSFWAQAYTNLRAARARVARRYDANRTPHKYKPGDMVMFRRNVVSSKARNVSGKLLMRWSHPVVVAKFVGPNTVLLANPETGVIVRRAHVSQLKAYVN